MEDDLVGRRAVQGFFLSFFLGGDERALFWLGDGVEIWGCGWGCGWEGEEVGGRLHGFFFFFLAGERVERAAADGEDGEVGAKDGCVSLGVVLISIAL